jgi:hypothetical protein
MSELIREALRYCERRSYLSSRWDDVNAYGRAQAASEGIREQGERSQNPHPVAKNATRMGHPYGSGSV